MTRISFPCFSFSCLTMKFITRGAVCLCLALGLAGCAQPTPDPDRMVRVCDPICSMRPASQVKQELRDIDEDDGRIAALEAEAAKNPRAAYDLGLRFFRGDGVRRNSYKAMSWMRVAAEKGDLTAQKALGGLYLTGLGEMGRDPNEAQTWLLLAASKGDRESQELLAEAEAAKLSNQEEYKMLNRWRSVFSNRWGAGYQYNYKWDGRSWKY